MFYTYVIQSESTGKIYIGHTNNLTIRLQRHNGVLNSKKTSYTNINRGPWKLVYKEEYLTRKEAKQREKQLKTARGREDIKRILSATI